MLSANAVRRVSVLRDSSRKVGRTRKESASSRSRCAVVWNTRFEFSISPRSWPRRSVRAANTSPVLRISLRTSPRSWSRIWRTVAVFSANGVRLPSASFRSWPRPLNARPWLTIHCWNACLVFGSKVRKISSSSTVGATLPRARRPPSRIVPERFVPGASST